LVHKKPNPTQIKQEVKYFRAVYVTLGPDFFNKNLPTRSFIFSEINTLGLLKFSKISFAFNIFVLIPVQEMVYLNINQKISPMDVSVSGTIDPNSAPYLPGSAYDIDITCVT